MTVYNLVKYILVLVKIIWSQWKSLNLIRENDRRVNLFTTRRGKWLQWRVREYPFAPGDPNASHLSVSERLVVKILGNLLDEGRHIITDNWYTSLNLSDYLQTRATMLTGAGRQGRGPPKTVQHEDLEKNQALFARKRKYLVSEMERQKGNLSLVHQV